MNKIKNNWTKEFEKKFMIREKTGLWTNPETFLMDNVFNFIKKLQKGNVNYMKKEKTKEKELGMKVKIKYTPKSAYYRAGTKQQIFRNVTEIHYCFDSPLGKQTALESDIHGTGCTIFNDEIKEFEGILEKEKARNF